jgi:Flp pilus assembly pilin Flp
MINTWWQFLRRLVREDDGQDIIEYGLLTGIVAAVGVLIFVSIRTKMGNSYFAWGTQIQNNWVPNAPIPPTP